MPVLGSLRVRLPLVFLAGIILAGLVTATIGRRAPPAPEPELAG